jgi:hypothetical protein
MDLNSKILVKETSESKTALDCMGDTKIIALPNAQINETFQGPVYP